MLHQMLVRNQEERTLQRPSNRRRIFLVSFALHKLYRDIDPLQRQRFEAGNDRRMQEQVPEYNPLPSYLSTLVSSRMHQYSLLSDYEG